MMSQVHEWVTILFKMKVILLLFWFELKEKWKMTQKDFWKFIFLSDIFISVFKLESNDTISIIKTEIIIRKVVSGLSIIFFPRWKAADSGTMAGKFKFCSKIMCHTCLLNQQESGSKNSHSNAKSGLISESFSLWLKSLKKCAKSLSWALSTQRENAQDSIWHIFWEIWAKVKNPPNFIHL